MKNALENILYSLYIQYKKNTIAVLERIGRIPPNHFNSANLMTVKIYLQEDKVNISDDECNKCINELEAAGLVWIANQSNVGLTEEGKQLLEKCRKFSLLGRWAKMEIVGRENFTILISLAALGVSIIALFVSVIALF